MVWFAWFFPGTRAAHWLTFILRKLEVSNRGEAAALAHRHGLTTR